MQAKFPICNDIRDEAVDHEMLFHVFYKMHAKLHHHTEPKFLYNKTGTTLMYLKQTLQLNFITSYLCIYCLRSKHAWCGNMGILFIE